MAKRARSAPRASEASASSTTSSGPPPGASGTSNHLTAAIARAGTEEAKRVAILKATNPLYTERHCGWRILLDAFEGAGGFLNGDYLWRYPNETNDDFIQRKTMARYHNYAKALVNIYVRHVFREGVKRETANEDLQAWWKNVDGARTPMSEFMKRVARLMLVPGHAGVLMDKTPDEATGPSLADDQGRIIASVFSATSILDWREDDGELTAVKLSECAPAPPITEPMPTGDEAQQYLLWDLLGFARFDATATPVMASNWTTPMGLVPFVVGRPEPSAEHPFLGLSLLGDPKVYQALYNRCSEQDEVARKQAFSVLACEVPAGKDIPDDAVAKAKTQITGEIGTSRALVVQGTIDFKTPDMGVLEALQNLIDALVQEMFRAAHIRFEKGSLQAESAEAIRLQHTELNEMLANLAAELQRMELEVARFWHFWVFPASTAQQEFEAAKVNIVYPREFFIADLLDELQKWANAIKLDLGLTFEHYAKKRVVDQLAPDLDAVTKQAVYTDIDGQQQNREQAMADAQARLGASVARLTAAGGTGTPPPNAGTGNQGDGQAGAKAA